MILKASQRGGDAALAAHLLNANDNEHIEVHSINGFVSSDVAGAFQEIRAAAMATNCKQYMFSLSLSPPEDANVSNADFEVAIERAMKRLGLAGQPHVVIFHEKNARRHAHVVISRIDTQSMTAINLSFFKDRLCDLSRELFIEQGWELPQGHVDRKLSDPLNYSLEEYQLSKRAGLDPKETKALLKDCWAQSDSKAGFEAALAEAGFKLCRGDRRGFVAIDEQGKIYSLSRWLNIKSKELKLRLGEIDHLPSIEEAIAGIDKTQLEFAAAAHNPDPLVLHLDQQIAELETQKSAMIQSHRSVRSDLQEEHHKRRIAEIRQFKKSNSTLRRIWQWATNSREKILIERKAQLIEYEKAMEAECLRQSEEQRLELRRLRLQIAELNRQRDAIEPKAKTKADLSQFVQKADPDFAFHKSQIEITPDYVLRLIADKEARFTRHDIVEKLNEYLSDPDQLRSAIKSVMQSSELIALDYGETANQEYTTRNYQKLHTAMMRKASFLGTNKAYGVDRKHLISAIAKQNKILQKSVGSDLSAEQRKAIEHVLNRRQLSCVIGLAGAGKSTMLAAAKDAWEGQSYRVIGGALAGKAADGLQSSSGIPSRTLHSYEQSWKLGKTLNSGDVLVVDEAGMVGTAQLGRIIKHVQEHKAKLVLVGDPNQLQPIEAGTPFRDISNQSGFAELNEIRRQKANWQKAASLDLAKGETEKAIQAYEDHGMVEKVHSEHDAIAALVEDYMVDWEMHGTDKSRIALAHKRKDVFAINKAIRTAKKSAGELTSGRTFETNNGKREFAIGDRILITRNDYDLNIRNGMLGWVKEIDPNQLVIKLDDNGKPESSKLVTINTRRFSSFDHGYSTTIHKAQGGTIDHSFILKSRSMDENLNYVAMTRHKGQLQIYEAENSNQQRTREINLNQDFELEL